MIGAFRPARARDELAAAQREHVRAEPRDVGIEHDPAETAWIVEAYPHPSVQHDDPPIPLRMVVPAAVRQLADRAHVVDEDPPGHAEVDPDRRSVGDHHELLASAVEAGDHRPHGRRVDAVLHDQWVRSLHPFDGLAGETGDPAPRQLDLQHLGHATSLANDPGHTPD